MEGLDWGFDDSRFVIPVQTVKPISGRATYYELRGWDPKTGKPTKKKLEELELFDVAVDLWE